MRDHVDRDRRERRRERDLRGPRDRDRRGPTWYEGEGELNRRKNYRHSRSRAMHDGRRIPSPPMFVNQEDRYVRSHHSPLRNDYPRKMERPLSGGIKRKVDPRAHEQRPGKRIRTQRFGGEEEIDTVVFAKPCVEIPRRTVEDEERLDNALKRIDLRQCLQSVTEACKRCGELICAKMGVQNLEELSELEEECNGILAQAIARQYPMHGIVAKQNADTVQNVPLAPTWFICPLEGRENFIRGSPFVCISVGLCVQKIPVLGLIYNPVLEQCASGCRGGGVYVDGRSIQLEDVKKMGEAIIIANEYCLGSLRKRLRGGAGVKSFRETGCYNQDFMDVIRGLCNGGFQERLPGPWSMCAGAALIEEAGGVVTDLLGNLSELEMKKRKLAFGPRKLVEEMLRYF